MFALYYDPSLHPSDAEIAYFYILEFVKSTPVSRSWNYCHTSISYQYLVLCQCSLVFCNSIRPKNIRKPSDVFSGYGNADYWKKHRNYGEYWCKLGSYDIFSRKCLNGCFCLLDSLIIFIILFIIWCCLHHSM